LEANSSIVSMMSKSLKPYSILHIYYTNTRLVIKNYFREMIADFFLVALLGLIGLSLKIDRLSNEFMASRKLRSLYSMVPGSIHIFLFLLFNDIFEFIVQADIV
jgi:hypothetical protein